jgi:hypothetical protein
VHGGRKNEDRHHQRHLHQQHGPQRAQQAWLLRHVGPNANLGNIGSEDVIALETLRRGLRYDTLDLLPQGSSSPVI